MMTQIEKKHNIEAIYPLSPMQQGMLFHTLYTPETKVYFRQMVCRLEGDLNVLAFERAWQRVVDRHTVLRTLFMWQRCPKPLQVVRKRVKVPWEKYDWRGHSDTEQNARLAALLQADQERGFELSKAPLMRLFLIQLTSDSYQFIWDYHHLIQDGWSSSLIIKEVLAFYQSFRLNQELHLSPPRPFRNYIRWLQEQSLEKAERFWREYLKGFSTPTSIPIAKSLSSRPVQEEAYDTKQIKLSVSTTTVLQAMVRQHQLTLNTVIQATWALLLSHYSGEDDVVFGVTVSGRPAALAGIEEIVGLFINTLPMRVQVKPKTPLLSWLKTLQAQQVEMRQYEYSSLVQVQQWSDVPRGLPMFESILVFENTPGGSPEAQEQSTKLKVCQTDYFDRTNYPLTLVVVPETKLSILLSYDCRQFDLGSIAQLMKDLETLLHTISNNLIPS